MKIALIEEIMELKIIDGFVIDILINKEERNYKISA
jgi:hypothetical protein